MLKKYSVGTGDRFGQQGIAQLKAVMKGNRPGVDITPVWNKSNREHVIIGTEPGDVRKEADAAVKELGWTGDYYVDADHIDLESVDDFLASSNFFTIDVADYIGEPADARDIAAYVDKNSSFVGDLSIPGIDEPFKITEELLEDLGEQYLSAIREAGRIYRHILEQKEDEDVVIEVSMDEVETPQTPVELFFILKGLADEGVKLHTVAPKFTGRFNKGVDYVGDVDQFAKEFEEDVLVIGHVVEEYDLPENLKLSLHSGSDKFSLYPRIHEILNKHNAGLHLKTSGTTWLEEIIGLSLSGDEGLKMTRTIYEEAYGRFEELTAPYATVIDIDESSLAGPDEFSDWEGALIANKLTHNPNHTEFDSQLRQFMHCSYKIAAEQGDDFIKLLQQHGDIIGKRVTDNLYFRHIVPIFLGDD